MCGLHAMFEVFEKAPGSYQKLNNYTGNRIPSKIFKRNGFSRLKVKVLKKIYQATLIINKLQ